MPTALIRFTQGATTDAFGRALIGVTGQPVTASTVLDPSVQNYTWSIIGVPLGSSVAVGAISSGAVATVVFTPDVPGCYMVHLLTSDVDGNMAEDFRAFGILETSGRLIPSFIGTDASMNFSGQSFGWAPYVEAYLKAIDAGTSHPLSQRDVSGTTAWNASTDYRLCAKSMVSESVWALPSSPSRGAQYAATDCDGTAPGNLTISGAGKNIANSDGSTAPAATFVWPDATKKYASFTWEFTGTIWSLV